MKIAIIGAGAGVGLLSVTQALEKGHKVVALSTNTEAMPPFITYQNKWKCYIG